MARKPPTPSTVKKLFALSGNNCASPNCQNLLVEDDTVLGEICHIEAAEKNGPRFNSSSDDEYRRSFKNLLLLCESCHKKVDNDVDKYESSMLYGWKTNHENTKHIEQIKVDENLVKQSIQKFMKQNNDNKGSGVQFNNQGSNKIENQIGVQNVFGDAKNKIQIDGARPINKKFLSIIENFKQDASAPTTDVIDFRNELRDRNPRPVESIPTKHLHFRKNNGRIIADVESYERENNISLDENNDETQKLLRKFLLNNDKEKNEELKRSLSQKGQQQPAIITCDGFLINGNRRKMALEELYNSKDEDSRFEMMRVVILPENVSELEIQKVENRYQLQSEGKSEYQGLNKAIKFQRNIENGFSLEAQLRDDPNYHELSDTDFKKKVREFKKNFLNPLECVDGYLETFNRKGMYNTVSESSKDKEGRWQAFIDYSNFKTGTLKNKSKLNAIGVKETEIGKIENSVFKIIRKRSLNTKTTEIGKVHDFVRKLPKYLKNPEAKKLILEIADINEDIPEKSKYDKEGNRLTEREIDEKWGANNRELILGNLIQAYGHLSSQEQRNRPLELLEDALKKLRHDNLKIENMGTENYAKALNLSKEIVSEAESIYKSIDHARYQLKKLSKKK